MPSNESVTTIARSVTAHVMTDGTIRLCEYDAFGDLDGIHPIYCANDEEALAYLRDTSALSVNPDWYRHE
jgi:hypothetical protein